jgi:hypothetical protein
VTAATDRVSGTTDDPEHGADDEQDHPDGPKDADPCEHADQQQDEASNDHETEAYRSGYLDRPVRSVLGDRPAAWPLAWACPGWRVSLYPGELLLADADDWEVVIAIALCGREMGARRRRELRNDGRCPAGKVLVRVPEPMFRQAGEPACFTFAT